MDKGAEERQRMLEAAEAEMEEKMKKDTKCGIGSCKSKKGANMTLFTLNLAAILLFHISLFRSVYQIHQFLCQKMDRKM